jgi:hypothetical protein
VLQPNPALPREKQKQKEIFNILKNIFFKPGKTLMAHIASMTIVNYENISKFYM